MRAGPGFLTPEPNTGRQNPRDKIGAFAGGSGRTVEEIAAP